MTEILQNTAKINDLKQEAKNIISQIADTVQIIDAQHSLIDECASTQEGFEQEEMVISVVGEFSSGKSCFLNSLLGEKVLTEADMPTTATITKLKYCEKPRMIVKFKDNKEKYLPEDNQVDLDPKEFPSELKEYTSELSKKFGGDDHRVSELIKEVICEYPNKILKEGITIVDTPGVQALVSGHKEMTEEQVKKSNAAICLFSCEKVGGALGEIEFFNFVKKTMGEKPNKLLFIANKMYKAQESVDKKQSEGRNYLEQKNHYIEKFKNSIQTHIGINRDEINIFGYDSEWSFSNDEHLKEKGGFYQVTHFIDQVLTSDQQIIESHLNDPLQRTKRLRDKAKEIVDKRLEQLNTPQDLESLNKNLEEFKEKEDALKVQMESKVNNLIANLKQIEHTLDKRFNEEIITAIKDFQQDKLNSIIGSVINKKNYQIALEQIKDFDHQIKEIIDDFLSNNFQKELENKLKEYGESIFNEISQTNYFNKDDIESLIEQINIDLNIDNKFGFGELSEHENIMKSFEKKKEEVENNIFKLQSELPFKTSKSEEINRQIKALEEQKRIWVSKIQNTPEPLPKQIKKVKYKEVKKQGILGYWFGKDWDYTVTEPEEYYDEDDTNVKKYERTMDDYHNKITNITKQISSLESDKSGLNDTSIKIQQNNQILNNLLSKQNEAQKNLDDYWLTVRQRLTSEVPSRLRKLKNKLNNLKTNKIDKVLKTISVDISKITNEKIQNRLDDVVREINRLKEDKQKTEQELNSSKKLVEESIIKLEDIDININKLEQNILELLSIRGN